MWTSFLKAPVISKSCVQSWRGALQEGPFQLSLSSFLNVDCQSSRVTSDGGLILVRELDGLPRSGEVVDRHLTYPRASELETAKMPRKQSEQVEGSGGRPKRPRVFDLYWTRLLA
jgi:hypothetical protein